MSAKIIALPFQHRPQGLEQAQRSSDRTISAELRRARIRIAQLEASLSEAMRDSLANFNRARDAERMIEKLQG